ncbi:DNA-binding domain-containing protein [Burkholderia multivorans]|uniref:HvfC/BufC N-terminal domain-containing protein n=1 Tax=Burkholderia multivorans TaxID=87883 RepID=UPI0007544988|nr:DNA-binding domain-containing protein [Burkholderia multivorans]AYZ01485.1 DUF2063 domain-containing protein [Burkholderia multivorans]KVV35185.1 hypothetical protein WK80_02705 [Burkholderia multivorans]MBU9119876.1 DNA-binding domain-containing protein [Burkholderia multivorans]MBU9201038.1 DNA-binding domain-containing protein [Burkholderia multivorans]MBU9232880.1 DNA-binding domain-containing protein [Burkholderia multivorans]
MSERLKHVQLEFVTSLLHPDAEQRLLGALVGDETNNRERVARYRARLWRTWHRVLACAYPVLRSLMGDDFFLTLSREYGIADPVRSGDLNRFGSRMAELLEAWPPTATCRHLADVARLEWLVHRACFAADATTRLPDPWAQCTRDTLAHCSVRLHPAVQLLHTSTRAADRWLAFHASGQAFDPDDVDRPQWMIVARPQWMPEVIAVSRYAFAMLSDLRDGTTIGDAYDAALARDAGFDFERNWQTWVEHGIIVAVDVGIAA